MLATGTDALAGQQDWNKLRYADDTLMLCVQGATHWDSLGHIFYEDKAYNGHTPKLIDSRGLSVLGIEHSQEQDERARRAARHRALPRRAWLKDGEGIGNDELDACAKAQGVEIRRARFRHHAHRADGALPRREGMGRLCRRRRAGREVRELLLVPREGDRRDLITDTWGCEVRPNETKDANQPWHWVVIPAMGLCMGEIFYLKELAEDCAKDKVYEFFFCGPPLIITGGTGSPINPQAIK